MHLNNPGTVPDRCFIGSQEVNFKNHFVFSLKENQINRAEAVMMKNNTAALISVNGELFLTQQTRNRYTQQGGEILKKAVIVEEVYKETSIIQKLVLGYFPPGINALLVVVFGFLITASIIAVGLGIPRLGKMIGNAYEYRSEQKVIQRRLAFDPVVYDSLGRFIESEPKKGDEILLKSIRFLPWYDDRSKTILTLMVPEDTVYEPDYSVLRERLRAYELLNNSPLVEIHREYNPLRDQSRTEERVPGWESWLSTPDASEVVRIFSESVSFQNYRDLLENSEGEYSYEMYKAYDRFINDEEELFIKRFRGIMEDAAGPDFVILFNDDTYRGHSDGYDFWAFRRDFFDYKHSHKTVTDDLFKMLKSLDELTDQARIKSSVCGIIKDKPYRLGDLLQFELKTMEIPTN